MTFTELVPPWKRSYPVLAALTGVRMVQKERKVKKGRPPPWWARALTNDVALRVRCTDKPLLLGFLPTPGPLQGVKQLLGQGFFVLRLFTPTLKLRLLGQEFLFFKRYPLVTNAPQLRVPNVLGRATLLPGNRYMHRVGRSPERSFTPCYLLLSFLLT